MAAFKNKDNGTWYVQFRYTDWRGERKQKLKRGFATKREAQAWEREFLMQKQADINMTFESFVALYEKDIKPKLKLNTWLTKESIIRKKILPYFKKRKLSEITAKDIIDWQNEIRALTDSKGKPYSTTYLKTVHNQLSAIFNHAIRYYGLQINPAQRAGNMGSEEQREMLFWTKEEYLKFADAMMDKPLSYYAFEISRSNLQNMRAFYLTYEKCQTLSGKLSWSHYCELLSISDPDKRSFYEKEAVNANWSVRELKRQIESSLFERLLLSRGDANKEQVLALALKGNEIAEPADIIRDPYVFEFLGLPEDKPVMESDLERALVRQIEEFLLELGRGFMFVGTQQRVTTNNTHYYVDMVFYNKILRAYVLIELKTTKLTPEAAGQINLYLNYYATEVNDPDDNPPIGIILCTEKDSITAEYALGGLSNNIFASRYVLYMPNKEQLIAQVEAVLKRWHGEDKDQLDEE